MATKKAIKPAKKSAAKKTPVKKVPAKKPTAKKALAKKPAAKKVPAKKPAVKKAPAKKPAVKKAPAKKVEPKKVAVKKTVAKTPVVKPVVKKSAVRKTIDKKVVEVEPAPVGQTLPPSEGIEFKNEMQNVAFLFAERMKRKQREGAAAADNSAEDIRLKRRPVTRERGVVTEKFSNADLADFRKALLALREAARTQSVALRQNALEQTDERGAEDEDGSDSSARLQSLGQLDAQHRNIQLIDDALRRIDNGTYGVCEECGLLIRKPRLLHLPFARTCMECQRAKEGR